MLYNYCCEHDIPHSQIGKLIVATGSSEIPKLSHLKDLGTKNGVVGLRMLEGFEAMRMEPELQCVKALLSPLSGIVDTHSLMLSLVVCLAFSSLLVSLPSTIFFLLTLHLVQVWGVELGPNLDLKIFNSIIIEIFIVTFQVAMTKTPTQN